MSLERSETLKGRLGGEWIDARFRVDKVIYGIERNVPVILLATPTDTGEEGVVFEVGKRYRVLAVIIDDRYMTWEWLGTYRIRE